MTVTFATARTWSVPSCTVQGLGRFNGTSRSYSEGGWQGLLHTVALKGLKAATSYTYECGSGPVTFQSAPPVGTLPVTLAAVADLGEDCNRPGCGNATVHRLGELAAAGAFDLLLHAGDIAYTGGLPCVWDQFFAGMQPVTSRVPYMVAVGNHEHFYNFSGYRTRFAMPGDGPATENLWYSFDFGGVHVAAFSTEHDLEPQAEWLKRDLQKAAANRAQVPWIVVMAHKPLYCSTNDYYDCEIGCRKIAGFMEEHLKEAGVDLFLAGHLHNYERTWPVFRGAVEARSYSSPSAPVHAVVGMAGDVEGLSDKWMAAPDWRATKDARLGFAMLHFRNASVMEFEYVLSETGKAADGFTLTKSRLSDVVVL